MTGAAVRTALRLSEGGHAGRAFSRYGWDRLKAQTRPGEGYSDAILRLLAAGDGIEGTRAR